METDERLEHGQYLLRPALAHMPKQGLDASDKREGDEKVNLKDKGDKNEEEETKKLTKKEKRALAKEEKRFDDYDDETEEMMQLAALQKLTKRR